MVDNCRISVARIPKIEALKLYSIPNEIWLVRDTYPFAVIWFARDTYLNAAIWLVRATYHSTLVINFFFIYEKKKKKTKKFGGASTCTWRHQTKMYTIPPYCFSGPLFSRVKRCQSTGDVFTRSCLPTFLSIYQTEIVIYAQ